MLSLLSSLLNSRHSALNPMQAGQIKGLGFNQQQINEID